MADAADIAASNDFTEEKLALHLNRKQGPEVQRGHCLFCKEPIKPKFDKDDKPLPLSLFCDPDESDCREEWERRDLLARKTGRMLAR